MDQGPEKSGPFFVGVMNALEAAMKFPVKTAMMSAFALVALAGCSTLADAPTDRIASATLSSPTGIPMGTAQILAQGDEVTLAVALTGVPAGAHGIHLHAVGKCAPSDFSGAGGHLNPLGKAHGSANPLGSHMGDLPNITIHSGGSGSLAVELAGTRSQIDGWLFDSDGTAIVLHADADDYRTDPSGNSGGRIACGVLSKTR